MRERPVTQGQQQISVTASMPRKAQGRVGWKDCIEQAASRGTMAFSEGTHPAQGILQGWSQGINLLVSFSSFPLTPTRTAHWLNPTRNQRAKKFIDAVHRNQFPEAQSRVGKGGERSRGEGRDTGYVGLRHYCRKSC